MAEDAQESTKKPINNYALAKLIVNSVWLEHVNKIAERALRAREKNTIITLHPPGLHEYSLAVGILNEERPEGSALDDEIDLAGPAPDAPPLDVTDASPAAGTAPSTTQTAPASE